MFVSVPIVARLGEYDGQKAQEPSSVARFQRERDSVALSPAGLFVASITATVLFQISKWAFGMYLRYAQSTTAIYGALSALVFFFLWLYYASVIFVFSAEVGVVFDRRRA